ncbi:expressed unknown protein [Seminavis robusta]|uniref:Autophagy-related protein n=1 Tax=Seminavis robusta TaxID=568900 RepID=A0A9N8H6F9_9STRA|nr:expressed unknown protein [Seminavis robusta]|eukprot:Sro111_g055200.1 n/a (558) ;mRNA; f:34659-36332
MFQEGATTAFSVESIADSESEEAKHEEDVACSLNRDHSWCCGWARFDGNITAQGYCVHGLGRGPIYMCTVFLSTAFIFLASEEVGCVDEDGQIVENCQERVYGVFRPAALVTNIATIAGLLVAFFLPLIGAIMDYTSHRWTLGVVTAILLLATEAIQIGTTSQTWFGMAVLEAVSLLLFETQITASLAYMPAIARTVGDESLNTYVAYFLIVEVALGQALYTLIVVAISTFFGLTNVGTAQVAQGLVTVCAGLGFYFGWKKFPKVPAKHFIDQDPEDEETDKPSEKGADVSASKTPQQEKKHKNLFLIGFIQNWNTFWYINREYKHSIRWFLLGCVFGDAAANAFLTVAVVVLTDEWGLSANEVGIFLLVGLLAYALACRPAAWVTNCTTPNISWRLAMIYTFVLGVIGALTVTKENAKPWSFVWGFVVCLGLGWQSQAQYTYVALITPKDQEAELAGFFNYCKVILAWMPPLLFSLLVEANVPQYIGIICTCGFFLLAVAALSMSAPWDEAMREVHGAVPAEGEVANPDDEMAANEAEPKNTDVEHGVEVGVEVQP